MPAIENACRPVPTALVSARLPHIKTGDVFSSLVAPVFKLSQIFCILSFSQTVVVICLVLQDVQCFHSDLVSSPCTGNVGCSQEGIGCHWHHNLGLHPATPLQPVPQHLQGCHLHVEPTKHHHQLIFTVALWPLPMKLLHQGKQWLIEGDHCCLPRIQMLHNILYDIH